MSPRPDLVARIARLTGVNVAAGAGFYTLDQPDPHPSEDKHSAGATFIT